MVAWGPDGGCALNQRIRFPLLRVTGEVLRSGGGYYQSATSEKTVKDQRDPIKSETPKTGIADTQNCWQKLGETQAKKDLEFKKRGGLPMGSS